MSEMRRDSTNPGLNTPYYSINLAFLSQIRPDFNSPLNFAVAYSAFP